MQHANDNVKPIKLLRYCDLSEIRGISYSVDICDGWRRGLTARFPRDLYRAEDTGLD